MSNRRGGGYEGRVAKHPLKLSTVLFFILLGLGIIPAALLIVSLLPGVMQAYHSAAEQHGLGVAQRQSGELTQRLERRRETVRNIAMLPAPLEMLRAGEAAGPGLFLNVQQAAERFSGVIRRWFNPPGDLRLLAILDRSGIEQLRLEAMGGSVVSTPPEPAPRHELGHRFAEAMAAKASEPRAVILRDEVTLRIFTPIRPPDGPSIGMLVMDFELHDVLGAVEGSRWVDGNGRYLQIGGHRDGSAFDDFPTLATASHTPMVASDRAGIAMAWVPLHLGPATEDVVWVGTPVDQSALRHGLMLLALGAVLIFCMLAGGLMVAVRLLTIRLDQAKKELMAGLGRMIAGQGGVRFKWRGPAEVRQLGIELSQLGEVHANAVRALRLSQFSVEHAGEGIIWLGETGKVLFVNDAACRQLNYQRDELLRMHAADLNPAHQDQDAWTAHWKELSQHGSLLFETTLHRKDGTSFAAEIAANHLRFEKLEYNFAFIRDVSERKAAAERLIATVEELTRSNTELERFAHVAAHDLQEPVRSVVSFAQLLERRVGDRLDSSEREILDFLVAGAKRMHALVHDLLAYAQVNPTAVPLAPTECADAFRAAVENLDARIRETNAHIEAAPLPRVEGDAGQLVQLFQNLLSNALKFSRPGVAPDIRVTAERAEGRWTIAVADNGIGIDPAYTSQLFTLFRRLHSSQYPGTGLGLALCKRIVERHGGRIWLQAAPDAGTTVLFTLKAAEDQSPR